jgi:hypothetical protein
VDDVRERDVAALARDSEPAAASGCSRRGAGRTGDGARRGSKAALVLTRGVSSASGIRGAGRSPKDVAGVRCGGGGSAASTARARLGERCGLRSAASAGSSVAKSSDRSGAGPWDVRGARPGDESRDEAGGRCAESPERSASMMVDKSAVMPSGERGGGGGGVHASKSGVRSRMVGEGPPASAARSRSDADRLRPLRPDGDTRRDSLRRVAPSRVGVPCLSLSLSSSMTGEPLENGRSARNDRNDGSDALAERTCSPAGDTLRKLVSLVFDARRGVSVGAFGGQRVQGVPSVITKVDMCAFYASNRSRPSRGLVTQVEDACGAIEDALGSAVG